MTSNLSVTQIFTEEALSLLRHRLGTSETAQDFLIEVDQIAEDPKFLLRLPESIELEAELINEDDADNAILIYEAIGPMDHANAADPRLWSYLSLVTFRDYMEKRWPLSERANFRGYVRDHWLLGNEARGRVRNGIARLWWLVNLTDDPDLLHPLSADTGDRYAYTRWVFKHANVRQSIFERRLGRNANLRWALMEEMQKVPEASTKDGAQLLLKYVFLHTGYQRLEFLNEDLIKQTVRGMIQKSLNGYL
ncbi:DUF6339 family protein [Corynebacterium auriscanis]|uniref:DUF6339 family protein n=1 Tax=Corynebacterium auriscanis TaxID=99807 RepID=UPI003CF5CFEB